MAYLMGTGSITQNVSGWQAGTYTLSFLAAQRGNYAGNAQVLQVKIDGAVVATITPSGTGYRTYTATFTVSAGAHSVAIVGTVADHTAFLDNVALVPTSRASQRWTVYDGDRPILDFNGAGTQTARYLQSGPDLVDEVLARETASGVAWYLGDRLGTIRDLADNSGAIIDHVDYSVFGKPTGETAPAVGDRMMGFAGMERSKSTGLNLAVHRVQDPGNGIWLSEDPIGFAARDPNLRRYVGNDPVNAIDPSGLESWTSYAAGKVASGGRIAAAGGLGLAQGALNTVNGVQDVGIGVLNTPALAWNWTAGWVAPNCPYIPSPDWSRGRITDEDPTLHEVSKFLGGSGVTALAPLVPKWCRGRAVGAETPASCAPVLQTAPKAVRTNVQLIQDIAARADRWGTRRGLASTGPVSGTLKHAYADRLLTRYQRMCGDRGLSTEVRYLGGELWRPGMPTKGSVRLDVVQGPLANPTKVFDYKFGGARLDCSRIERIRACANLGQDVPVIGVRP